MFRFLAAEKLLAASSFLSHGLFVSFISYSMTRDAGYGFFLGSRLEVQLPG